MKAKTKTEKLKAEIQKLLKSHDANELFDCLVSAAHGTTDEDYLKDQVISYLNVWHGLNVVKLNGLTEQMEFEKAIQQIIPFQNQQNEQLFLTY